MYIAFARSLGQRRCYLLQRDRSLVRDTDCTIMEAGRCSSSTAVSSVILILASRISYNICVMFNAVTSYWFGFCGCDDFNKRNGACKHLRALQTVCNGRLAIPRSISSVASPPTVQQANEMALRVGGP